MDREALPAPGSLASLTLAIRRRPKLNLIAFTLTVLVAVAGLVTADLWWRRDDVLKTAETCLANLATVPEGAYFLFAAVKIQGCHGGPGRAIALW